MTRFMALALSVMLLAGCMKNTPAPAVARRRCG
jgi:hypothetical protein